MSARRCVIVALVASCLAAGCQAERRPNVLVVVMDACRPDKLGCYGFERPTSPAIDRLAADHDSVVFERHYVQGNWTKPSTASLFTGLYVYQHRVVDDGVKPDPDSSWLAYVHDQLRTMAEDFRQAGYFTWGQRRIPHLDARFGFDQGFDVYSERPATDEGLAREALRLARSSEGPFFGWVHFLACHFPYPAHVRSRSYVLEHASPYVERERASVGVDFTDPGLARRVKRGRVLLEPEDVQYLNVVYESTLRRFDDTVMEPLLQGLRDSGLYDDTLIVVTADHGEELYDHAGYGHGHALWEEVINVPLIIKFPRGERPPDMGPRWTDPSRVIDLFPTLTAAVGLDPPQGLPGRNLLRGPGSEIVLSEAGRTWTAIRGDEKLILKAGTPPRLFDLRTDRAETRNLAALRPEVVLELREAVRRLRAAYRPPELDPVEWGSEPLSPEAIETLRSLGYVE